MCVCGGDTESRRRDVATSLLCRILPCVRGPLFASAATAERASERASESIVFISVDKTGPQRGEQEILPRRRRRRRRGGYPRRRTSVACQAGICRRLARAEHETLPPRPRSTAAFNPSVGSRSTGRKAAVTRGRRRCVDGEAAYRCRQSQQGASDAMCSAAAAAASPRQLSTAVSAHAASVWSLPGVGLPATSLRALSTCSFLYSM